MGGRPRTMRIELTKRQASQLMELMRIHSRDGTLMGMDNDVADDIIAKLDQKLNATQE